MYIILSVFSQGMLHDVGVRWFSIGCSSCFEASGSTGCPTNPLVSNCVCNVLEMPQCCSPANGGWTDECIGMYLFGISFAHVGRVALFCMLCTSVLVLFCFEDTRMFVFLFRRVIRFSFPFLINMATAVNRMRLWAKGKSYAPSTREHVNCSE